MSNGEEEMTTRWNECADLDEENQKVDDYLA